MPSGASTGAHEAVELRDGDKTRYGGKGVRKAVDGVNGEIFDALSGFDAADQRALDRTLIELDGTPNKARLGANAILGRELGRGQGARRPISACRSTAMSAASRRATLAGADDEHRQWRRACRQSDRHPGIHDRAGGRRRASPRRCAWGAEVFHALQAGAQGQAGHNTNVGDEGGFAPNLKSADEALGFIMRAIEAAGYSPGEDVALALDPAASEFYRDGKYVLAGEGKTLDAGRHGRISTKDLVARYPIVSIEDGMAEDDWDGWTS